MLNLKKQRATIVSAKTNNEKNGDKLKVVMDVKFETLLNKKEINEILDDGTFYERLFDKILNSKGEPELVIGKGVSLLKPLVVGVDVVTESFLVVFHGGRQRTFEQANLSSIVIKPNPGASGSVGLTFSARLRPEDENDEIIPIVLRHQRQEVSITMSDSTIVVAANIDQNELPLGEGGQTGEDGEGDAGESVMGEDAPEPEADQVQASKPVPTRAKKAKRGGKRGEARAH